MSRVKAHLASRLKIPLWGVVAAAMGAAMVGGLVGNNTPWGSKELTVKAGRAMLHNTDNWLTSFDTDDPDDQLAFHADSVWWSGPGLSGQGVPPCLERENTWAQVRVAYTWVDFPDGGSAPFLAWVECLESS
jgi:hypothetical protein